MLVVIGLIVGGVLVGQSLISAAEVRAQITQIEKYQTAVSTFRSKFNAIPGDMRPEIAQQFGFTVGTNCTGAAIGSRNGDGLIDGLNAGYTLYQGEGETALFWSDLSYAGLIDGAFTGSSVVCGYGGNAVVMSGTLFGNYFPPAKLGHGNYIIVYDNNSTNWFDLSALTNINNSGGVYTNNTVPVIEAYNIDKKIDDGFPVTGNVQAVYINANFGGISAVPNTTTSGGTSSSCYDTTTGTYSVTVNNGNGGNCALSFKFQ